MPVAASPATAWAVLTDYDHMANFLSNVTPSQVVERQGETLHVPQGRIHDVFVRRDPRRRAGADARNRFVAGLGRFQVVCVDNASTHRGEWRTGDHHREGSPP